MANEVNIRLNALDQITPKLEAIKAKYEALARAANRFTIKGDQVTPKLTTKELNEQLNRLNSISRIDRTIIGLERNKLQLQREQTKEQNAQLRAQERQSRLSGRGGGFGGFGGMGGFGMGGFGMGPFGGGRGMGGFLRGLGGRMASGGIGSMIGGAAGAVTGVGAALAGFAAVDHIKDTLFDIDAAMEALQTYEPIRTKLSMTAEDSRMATRTFEELTSLSQKYGLSLRDVSSGYSSFAIASKFAGMTSEETLGQFEQLSKVFSALQMTGHESQLVLKALEQMMNKGTVSSEELRHQLGDRIPGAFELFAKSMGVSTRELGEMMKKGEVLTKDTLPKFIDLLGDTFGSGAQKNADSLVASQNRLNNAADKYNTILGEKIKPGLQFIYGLQKQIYDLGIKAMGGEVDEKKTPTLRELVKGDLTRYKYEGAKVPGMALDAAQRGLLALYDKKISDIQDKLPQLRLDAAGYDKRKEKKKLKNYQDALTKFQERREDLINYMSEGPGVEIIGEKKDKEKGKKSKGEKLKTDYHTPKILNINILTGDGASLVNGGIQTDINTLEANTSDIRQNIKDILLAQLNDVVNDTATAVARVSKASGAF